MKMTDRLFNPVLDTDVLVHRIVGKFKMCIAIDEWMVNSSESEKILGLFPPVDDEINQSVAVLKAMGYDVKNENSYYGSPYSAIKYYPK